MKILVEIGHQEIHISTPNGLGLKKHAMAEKMVHTEVLMLLSGTLQGT